MYMAKNKESAKKPATSNSSKNGKASASNSAKASTKKK